MIIIAGLAYKMTQQDSDQATAIPVLGALALGALRLLPAIQQAFASYSSLRRSKSSFEDTLDMLEQPLPSYANLPPPAPISFDKEIALTNLSFRYAKDTPLGDKAVELLVPGALSPSLIELMENLLGSNEEE